MYCFFRIDSFPDSPKDTSDGPYQWGYVRILDIDNDFYRRINDAYTNCFNTITTLCTLMVYDWPIHIKALKIPSGGYSSELFSLVIKKFYIFSKSAPEDIDSLSMNLQYSDMVVNACMDTKIYRYRNYICWKGHDSKTFRKWTTARVPLYNFFRKDE